MSSKLKNVSDLILYMVQGCTSSDGRGHLTKTQVVSMVFIFHAYYLRVKLSPFSSLDWKCNHIGPWAGGLLDLIESLKDSKKLIVQGQYMSDELDLTSNQVMLLAGDSNSNTDNKLFEGDKFLLYLAENIRRAWSSHNATDELLRRNKALAEKFCDDKNFDKRGGVVCDLNRIVESKPHKVNFLPPFENVDDMVLKTSRPNTKAIYYVPKINQTIILLKETNANSGVFYTVPIIADDFFACSPLHYPINYKSTQFLKCTYYVLVKRLSKINIKDLLFKCKYPMRLRTLTDDELSQVEMRLKYWYNEYWYDLFYKLNQKKSIPDRRTVSAMLSERIFMLLSGNIYDDNRSIQSFVDSLDIDLLDSTCLLIILNANKLLQGNLSDCYIDKIMSALNNKAQLGLVEHVNQYIVK